MSYHFCEKTASDMKIVVDAFGGDNAPQEIVNGALMALQQCPDLQVVLVGEPDVLAPMVGDNARVTLFASKDIIDCNETPVVAIRRKPNSSIVRMFDALARADGAVSAGSTGAVLAGGIFLLGRLPGVQRPALCPVLPTVRGGRVLLVDCGANVDCKPQYLVQFAHMGCAYATAQFGVERPRVALLSNGVEDEKGNELIKEVNRLLRDSNLNFVGNAEAREMLSGDFDVLVCDGFNGNIALKSAEGTAGAVFGLLKEGINASFRAKLGALLLKPVLKNIKKRMDYTEHGGAAFLGVKKPLVKAHGAAKAKSVCAAILQCDAMARNDVVGRLAAALEGDHD